MVNFNSEATVGVPAEDVEKISILQRRYDFIEAVESYNKQVFRKIQPDSSVVRARLMSLFLEVYAMLKRRLEQEVFSNVEKICTTGEEFNEVMSAFLIINNELDVVRLIKIDTRVVYNERNVEEENKIKGF